MEEASLDDFFAKKDKSKKKSKSKLTPAELLEKQSEDSKPKKEKRKKDKEKSQTTSTSQCVTEKRKQDDEEWIDFQEETEKDYSGLRIQNLQITKEEEEEREEGEELEEGEDGEQRERQGGVSGPWIGAKPQQQSKPSGVTLGGGAPPEPAQPPKPKEEPAVPKVPGKYVPPGARGALGSGGSSAGPQAVRRKKEAPNIKSEVDFPTLGGMSKEFSQEGSPEANYEHPGSKRGMQQLSLENKFAALQD